LTVQPDGGLALRLEARLRFQWRGRPCSAALSAERLALAAEAGWIPFTAAAAADRPRAFAALASLATALPQGWRVRLTPAHRVTLETVHPLPAPPTAVLLVAALVRFTLTLDPYLDRLEAAGAGYGSANTWPG
jgi:hypothetical protein